MNDQETQEQDIPVESFSSRTIYQLPMPSGAHIMLPTANGGVEWVQLLRPGCIFCNDEGAIFAYYEQEPKRKAD